MNASPPRTRWLLCLLIALIGSLSSTRSASIERISTNLSHRTVLLDSIETRLKLMIGFRVQGELSSGIAGNVVNAVVYKAGHTSIGASTAVFGALGILSAWQVLRRVNQPGKRLKALLPLGAGLALLGFMGSSVHTDVLAHLFGFLSGIVIGGLYGATVHDQPGIKIQTLGLVLTAIILLRAWLGAY